MQDAQELQYVLVTKYGVKDIRKHLRVSLSFPALVICLRLGFGVLLERIENLNRKFLEVYPQMRKVVLQAAGLFNFSSCKS